MPENCENQNVSEFNEILLGNLISREESNSEVYFIIRDLEKFKFCNLYTSDNLPFCHFSEKFQVLHLLCSCVVFHVDVV